MPRRSVTAPASLLLNNEAGSWLMIKMELLKNLAVNTGDFASKVFEDKVDKHQLKKIQGLAAMEMVISTVHYAEVLASYLIGFRQGKTIQRKLLSYKADEIKYFYSNINKKSLAYIAKLFSYPQATQTDSKKLKRFINTSCRRTKKDLVEVGKYYLENLELYNSYKHGFRIAYLQPGEVSDYGKGVGVIAHLNHDKNFYPASFTVQAISWRKPLKISKIIYGILHTARNNFNARFVKGEAKTGRLSLRFWRSGSLKSNKSD